MYLRFWLRFVGPATETIELSLPDERFGDARYVGSYWNRTSTIEVDLIGGDARPRANTIPFVGSIKWRDDQAFHRADTAALATQRASVPGADAHTALLGVARQAFDVDAGLDAQFTADNILAAYRPAT